MILMSILSTWPLGRSGSSFALFPSHSGLRSYFQPVARVGADDLVGPARRWRVDGEVLDRGVGGKRRDEHQPELVGEDPARFGQIDDDFPGLVVRLDPGNRPLLGLLELFGADDRFRVEGRAARVELDHPFDREPEVGRLDRGPVGVFEALLEHQRVGLAAVGDLRHARGQPGDDLAARLVAFVGIGQERDVRVVHRGPAFLRVGEGGVEVVGEAGVGADQGAAFFASRFAAAASTGGQPDRRRDGNDRYHQYCRELSQRLTSGLD